MHLGTNRRHISLVIDETSSSSGCNASGAFWGNVDSGPHRGRRTRVQMLLGSLALTVLSWGCIAFGGMQWSQVPSGLQFIFLMLLMPVACAAPVMMVASLLSKDLTIRGVEVTAVGVAVSYTSTDKLVSPRTRASYRFGWRSVESIEVATSDEMEDTVYAVARIKFGAPHAPLPPVIDFSFPTSDAADNWVKCAIRVRGEGFVVASPT